jgi:hypothetical protein
MYIYKPQRLPGVTKNNDDIKQKIRLVTKDMPRACCKKLLVLDNESGVIIADDLLIDNNIYDVACSLIQKCPYIFTIFDITK